MNGAATTESRLMTRLQTDRAKREGRAMATRQPTAGERARERAVFLPVLADVGATAMLLGFGVLTASLTLLSEGIRSLVMLFASVYALVVMRAIHRSRLGQFEFGVGKLEQFVTLVVGLGLIGSALWVADSAVLKALGDGGPAPSPLGLALAAIVNAVNAAINTLGWLGMSMAGRGEGGDSEIYRAQLRARFVMMSSSLLLQVTLTIAALAKDVALAVLLDVAGAGFVAVLMFVNGVTLLRRALPELLDAPPAHHVAARIREVVAGHVPPHALAGVRARRAGGKVVAEIVLCGDDSVPPAALERQRRKIDAALVAAGADVDLAMTVSASPAQPAKAPSSAATNAS